MTPDELPKYDVKYVGREQVDEVSTYVLTSRPKNGKRTALLPRSRLVDDKDLQIVKTRGKAPVSEEEGRPAFRLSRPFGKYRGSLLVPTYTRADDVLHFKTGPDVRIRVSVKYTNYSGSLHHQDWKADAGDPEKRKASNQRRT